jgi:hypothetical protein
MSHPPLLLRASARGFIIGPRTHLLLIKQSYWCRPRLIPGRTAMMTLAPPIPFAGSQLGKIRHVRAFFSLP